MDAQYVYEYAVPVTFPASQADTFAALSDEKALKVWFAEHAEIDAREGGAYRFWGKHTLDTKRRGDATQTIAHYGPVSTLSFNWRLLGRDSKVTWIVAADGEKTSKVTIRHEFSSLPDGVRAKEMIDDLWRLNTGNLCFYLMGEREIYRPDFDDPNPVVRQSIVINASPEKVFAALITPEQISQWFPAPAPVVEPKVGGKYGFGFSYEVDGKKVEPPPMTILEFEENRRLAISWPDWRGDASVPDQKVTWTLEPAADGKTKLTLTHSGFIRAVDVSDYPFGWVEFLNKIGEVAMKV
ncbi:MAG TPA: SRPBCC domain-containing protein [Parvularculaceae bacterium]|nr:SRPBCC domain-containing protein [Parvularculaceae bacterium]HNS87293.1 SRPBCC domain-containing protein [Parvularculaceae bacterium]